MESELSGKLKAFLVLLAGLCFCIPAQAINFLYDGLHRRPVNGATELQIAASTGNIFCRTVSGELRFSTGFIVATPAGQKTLLTSGHVFTDKESFQAHPECYFKPYGANSSSVLDERLTGPQRFLNKAEYVRNDWGVATFANMANLPPLTVSQRSFNDIMALVGSGEVQVKLYSTEYAGVADDATIYVSDECTVMAPGVRSILGQFTVFYTNCDSAGGSSGGPLVIEFRDGAVEVIGVVSGSAQSNEARDVILSAHPEISAIDDLQDGIAMPPRPETIINVAIPLIPEMLPATLQEKLFAF